MLESYERNPREPVGAVDRQRQSSSLLALINFYLFFHSYSMAKKKKKRVVSKSENQNSKATGATPEELDSNATPKLASFEGSLHDLEMIVAELESGQLSLADSLAKYESGIRNLKTCHQILENAENRIRMLTGVGKDGTPQTTEFDAQKTELYQRSDKRSMDVPLGESSFSVDDSEDVQSNDQVDGELEDDDGRLF